MSIFRISKMQYMPESKEVACGKRDRIYGSTHCRGESDSGRNQTIPPKERSAS